MPRTWLAWTLVTSLAASLAACADAPAAAGAPGAQAGSSGQAAVLPLRELARGEQSNVEASKQAVARTQAQWTTLWKEHEWENPAPAVDFSKEMAVAVFLGTQPAAGVGVRITEVSSQAGGGTLIRYQVTRPGAGAVAAQVLTFPYHIVAVAAHDGPYTFQKID